MDRKTGIIEAVEIKPEGSTFMKNEVFSIYENSEGELLFATEYGLYRYNFNEDNFKKVLLGNDISYHLNQKSIFALKQDIKGNYWMRAIDGLYMLNKKTD